MLWVSFSTGLYHYLLADIDKFAVLDSILFIFLAQGLVGTFIVFESLLEVVPSLLLVHALVIWRTQLHTEIVGQDYRICTY